MVFYAVEDGYVQGCIPCCYCSCMGYVGIRSCPARLLSFYVFSILLSYAFTSPSLSSSLTHVPRLYSALKASNTRCHR